MPAVDQLEVADQHAFFGQVFREGRHRAGHDAADLGVMGAAGGEEQQPAARRIVDRRDDGHVGQVRAAAIGIVGDEHVAGARSSGCRRSSRAPFRPSPPGGPECAAR